MISVIVYGRNDSHGYNLHKRVAISLNAFGELLTDASDEIMFVDYNTPDDLPTFPEAIRDTISPSAKRLLRVIRVRPSFHRPRFAGRTHLNVVEPVARNVAIRRVNPTNRWVLSTNSDMVFVPTDRNQGISDIVRSFEDGFYHLPRFELPEAIWESFNRLDGRDVIDRVRSVGRRFHLDEVVLAQKLIVYDGPGDFQLALRDDLFDMGGFEEAMILGWHVDSNLAARMTLQRGEILSAKAWLRGYHCDHTRQATIYHASDAVQNDWERFVFGVTEAEAVRQPEGWGYPDEVFEEFRLDHDDTFVRYERALRRAIPEEQHEEYVSAYNEEGLNRLDYRVDHVFPFFADLLSNQPPRTRILHFGITRLLLNRLTAALPDVLPEGTLVVPEDAPCLSGGPPDAAMVPDAALVRVQSLDQALQETDILIFEFAAEDAQAPPDSPGVPWSDADQVRLARVRLAFLTAVEHEEARLAAPEATPRRFVVVNAIHNNFEALVRTHLNFPLSPFSSRLRQGFLRRASATAKAAPPALEVIRARMGRRWLPPPAELRTLEALLDAWTVLAETDPAAADDLLANYRTPLQAFATTTLIPSEARERLATALDRLPVAAGVPVTVEEREPLPAGGGLYEVWDWEDPDWFRFARRHGGGTDATDWFDRTPRAWERASLLRLLDRHGLLNTARRILTCTFNDDEGLSVAVAEYANVVKAKLGRSPSAPLAAPDPERSDPGALIDRARLTAWRPGEGPFDAVVAPRHALFSPNADRLGEHLDSLWPLLKPAGQLVFSGLVDIGAERGIGHVSLDAVRWPKESGWLPLGTGFQAVAPFRLTLSAASLERRCDRIVTGRRLERTVDVAKSAAWIKGVFVFERLPSRPEAGPGRGA